jgi:hypothetical protein
MDAGHEHLLAGKRYKVVRNKIPVEKTEGYAPSF